MTKNKKKKKTEKKDPKAFMKKAKDKKEVLEPKTKDQQIQELTEMLKRTQADFINFKNRVEKETQDLYKYSTVDLVKKLLPVLDSFELALINSQDLAKFKEGVELVYAQLLDAFKQEGVKQIKAIGEKFDPYKHEVLLKGKSDKEPDTIIEELQKGYELKEKVIRHSKVKISE